MIVFEFINMFIDENMQLFELWDNDKEEIIFKGYLEDLPEKLGDARVTSIDNIVQKSKAITLNIDV